MSRVALWLRVSTEEQHAENQRPALEAFAKERGFEIVRVYEAQASAFKGRHNPVIATVIKERPVYAFDTLIVWSLDRLDRRGVKETLETISRLQRAGIRVLSQAPGEDWTVYPDGFGDVMLSLFAWVANMESRRRSERTKAGLARAAEAGRKPGRPKGSTDSKPRRKRGYFARYA